MKKPLQKLVVIVGPTASGKSSLAIRLAKRFKGQIVSADSRQIYADMEIGSGMVTKKETRGIPHFLLAFRNPKQQFSAEQYKRKAIPLFKSIAKKGNIPMLVGGTGFWIQTVIDNVIFPKTKPNPQLRARLENKTPTQLFALLKKCDPKRAKTIDRHNPRRLIRVIEIAQSKTPARIAYGPRLFDCLIIGIAKEKTTLRAAIAQRFRQWLRQGLLREVQHLMNAHVLESRFREFGLHYYYAYAYLSGMMTRAEFEQKSVTSLWRYAKRQMTWFKKDKRVVWISSYREAKKLVDAFLFKPARDGKQQPNAHA